VVASRATGAVAVVAGLPVLALGTVFSLLLLGSSSEAATCNPAPGASTSVTLDPATVPDTVIAGYDHEQLVNAAHIITAGKALGLGARDQTIGVMTAMGESSLRVIDHGDAAGPDSRGLFQQRDNGAWGSYEDRMDPYISATNFFTAMIANVPGRESLEPTIVAHRTQRNADPFHYTKYWDRAVAIVEGLSGVDTGLNAGTGDQVCTGGAAVPGEVTATGWAVPAAGPIVSVYGMRLHPIDKVWRLHSGVDLGGGGCDGPIWAAQDGVVTFTGFDRNGNGTITIDHGGGVQTSYLHQYASGILVRAGDQVNAGDQIGRVGSSGQSTGCHLHFSVLVDGSPTDPVPFMNDMGIQLG
jgi:hypothetical protein